MNKQKLILLVVWLLILAIGPLTVLRVTPLAAATADKSTFLRFLQRNAGLLAFSLLPIQITLGAFMPRWVEKFGGFIFKFHLFEGALIYSLILTHPIFFVVSNYFSKGSLDPFYVFTDICVLCRNNLELYYTFGRVAFWLISIAILAAEIRTRPWWREHWRKFHILNYFVFFLVAIHSYLVGTDIHFAPFVYFWWFAVVLVSVISLIKLKIFLFFKKTTL